MIEIAAIKARFEALEPVLDERERRLFAANEARAAGHGGVIAASRATGIARSTIERGLSDLRSGTVMFSPRVCRTGGGGKSATETQPGLLEALHDLVQSSIRGDPEAALLWVSKSQRHLSAALAELGFRAGQKLVGRLLKRLGFSLQANAKTREGTRRAKAPAIPTVTLRARARITASSVWLPWSDGVVPLTMEGSGCEAQGCHLVVGDLDANAYEKGIKVTDDEMASLSLTPASFHGEWNYTIAPRRPDG